jgi:BirA family transcriptional regulator, biotin operon repressor / biotin---[acetyl-CoA-carboxylase] ligase
MTPTDLDINRLLAETRVAQVEQHPTLSSTNDRAKQCAENGTKKLPLLVVADEQTAGRGRGNNSWWSGNGSLTFSLLYAPDAIGTDKSRSPLAALAAGVAVVDAVSPLLPDRAVGIHWPNDVYVEQRKLAGILVEVLGDGQCVVGIGVNLNNSLSGAPVDIKQRAASILDLTGVWNARTALLIRILQNLDDNLKLMAGKAAEIALRADRLCLQHGRTLTLRLGNQEFTGRCLGIDSTGGLALDLPEGKRSFHSGTLVNG